MDNWYCRIIAAFSFFTRLPFWRLANVPKESYEHVVPLWSMVGFLTGGVMALLFWVTSSFLPLSVSLLLAFMVRVLMTGAIHEDGFADFCDGFGGGTTRQRILDIMKDSHIGTYGVLGLVFYYLLLYNLLVHLAENLDDVCWMAFVLVCADIFCKWVASTIIYFLPYARKESESKNQLVYATVTASEKVFSLLLALLPFLALTLYCGLCLPVILSAISSVIVGGILFFYMHKKIQGYTGDCCGATFIICELSFYLALSSFWVSL